MQNRLNRPRYATHRIAILRVAVSLTVAAAAISLIGSGMVSITEEAEAQQTGDSPTTTTEPRTDANHKIFEFGSS